MNIGIIGLGLIGGSMGIALKEIYPNAVLIGSDHSIENCNKALELGLVDIIADSKSLYKKSELILLCLPVDATSKLLPEVLSNISDDTIVMDMGSTKLSMMKAVENHIKRKNYIACHPIAGTENSGPLAAIKDLFKNKVAILCNLESSATAAVEKAEEILECIGMRIVKMSAEEHDRHLAYVSHLSHISSFMLGLTVLNIEKDEKNIFDLAGSGFESTVRLAKSSAEMWTPILKENAENILNALDSYINHLSHFRYSIANKREEDLRAMIVQANDIRRVLPSPSLQTPKLIPTT